MFWAFGKLSFVINIWLIMNVMAFLVFPLFRFWHASRTSWMRIPNGCWLVFYLGYIAVFIAFPIQEICIHQLPPVSSIIVLCEQVIALFEFLSFFAYFFVCLFLFCPLTLPFTLYLCFLMSSDGHQLFIRFNSLLYWTIFLIPFK